MLLYLQKYDIFFFAYLKFKIQLITKLQKKIKNDCEINFYVYFHIYPYELHFQKNVVTIVV